MKGQQVVLCPQCGENKVKSNADGLFQFSMVLGVLFCITLIGIPVGIIFIITGFVLRKSKAKLKFRCISCKHDFKVNEDTFEDYKKAIS